MLRNGFTGAPLGDRAAPSFFAALQFLLVLMPALFGPSSAGAEDVPFSPRKDVEQSLSKRRDTEKPAKVVYSFARYEGALRPLCRAMKPDGHVDRLVECVEGLLREESECQSCRALARAVDVACRDFGSKAEEQKSKSAKAFQSKRANPTPVPTEAEEEPAADSEQETGGDAEAEQPAEGEVSAALPLATPSARAKQRLPSVQVVELASALSVRMQSDEPGPEPTLKALDALLQRVLASPGISQTERDYFSTLREYLISAWQGRPAAASGHEHSSGHGDGAH